MSIDSWEDRMINAAERLKELDDITFNLEGEKALTPKLLVQWLYERRSLAKRVMELEKELTLVLE